MTHSMFMAIISFVAFVGIAYGAFRYLMTHTSMGKDLKDDLRDGF